MVDFYPPYGGDRSLTNLFLIILYCGVYMGICTRVASRQSGKHPEQLYAAATDKIILNYLSLSPDDRSSVISRLTTTVSSELSIIPSCQCGFVKDYLGLGIGNNTCPKCNTTIQSQMIKDTVPVIFFTMPMGIDYLIQPVFLIHFKAVYNKKSFDTLLYLLDTSYANKDEDIEALNLPRGFNNFIHNIEQIILALNNIAPFKKKASAQAIYEEYVTQKHDIHTNWLYVINRALMIIDKSPLQTRLQPAVLTLTEIVLALIGIDNRSGTMITKHNRFGRAIRKLVTFYEQYFKEILGGKKGGIRTSMFAHRATVGMYCVLTSITTNIRHPEEMHLPYAPTLHMIYPQVVGRLIAHGFTYPQAIAYIQKYTHTYSKQLADIMQDIMLKDEQARDMVFQRYPTLHRGNILNMVATKIKTNVRDMSVSASILAASIQNFDLDGDAVVTTPMPPYPEFQNLRGKYSMLDMTKPRQINGYLKLTAPVVTNIMSWREHMLANTKPSTVDVVALYGV